MFQIPKEFNSERVTLKFLEKRTGKGNHPILKRYNPINVVIGGVIYGEPVILQLGPDIFDESFMKWIPMVNRNANVNRDRPKWIDSGFDLVSWVLEDDDSNVLYVFEDMEEYNTWLETI
jgi:hypothetical protein